MEVVSFEMSWPARSVTPLGCVSVIQTASSARLAGGAASTSATACTSKKKYTLYYPSEMRAVRNGR